MQVINQNSTKFELSSRLGQVDVSLFSSNDTLIFSHINYPKLMFLKREIKKDSTFYLNPIQTTLKKVVISSSRFEEKKSETARQIDVIDAKQIAFENPQTAADLLTNSGEVLVQKSQQGGGSPILRGFEANKVLIVIDGIRMNNAIYRGGHLQNVITLDPSILERTEVLFGAGSVIYGSDALGGVMHFRTKSAALSDTDSTLFSGNAYGRISSVNKENTFHVDLNYSTKRFAALSSFTRSDFSDLIKGKNALSSHGNWGERPFYIQNINGSDSLISNPNIHKQLFSGYTQYDLLQKLRFSPKLGINHVLNLQFSTSSDVPRYDRLSQLLADSTPKFSQWYYGPQKRVLSAYQFEKKLNGLSDLMQFSLAYQSIEESRHNRSVNSSILRNRTEHLHIGSMNLDFSKNIFGARITYGLEGVYNRVNSSAFSRHIYTDSVFSLNTRYPDGGSDYYSFAAYVTDKIKCTERFTLLGGIRYSFIGLKAQIKDTVFFPFLEREFAQKNGAINGNIGAVYAPDKTWKISTQFSSGFRSPNIDDLSKVFETVIGTVIIPNTKLKPERTYNIEASIDKTIAQKLKLALTGYYTRYTNAITTINAQLDGQDSIVYQGVLSNVVSSGNAQKAYIYGYNTAFEYTIIEPLVLEGSLNYTFGRIVADSLSPLDHIPPLFGKLSLRYKTEKYHVECFSLFNGSKRKKDYNLLGEDNFTKALPTGTPSWYTLNVRGAYTFNTQLEIQVRIDNILDKSYRVFASGIHAPGRNFSITLRLGF